jgi:hypothetical protein
VLADVAREAAPPVLAPLQVVAALGLLVVLEHLVVLAHVEVLVHLVVLAHVEVLVHLVVLPDLVEAALPAEGVSVEGIRQLRSAAMARSSMPTGAPRFGAGPRSRPSPTGRRCRSA